MLDITVLSGDPERFGNGPVDLDTYFRMAPAKAKPVGSPRRYDEVVSTPTSTTVPSSYPAKPSVALPTNPLPSWPKRSPWDWTARSSSSGRSPGCGWPHWKAATTPLPCCQCSCRSIPRSSRGWSPPGPGGSSCTNPCWCAIRMPRPAPRSPLPTRRGLRRGGGRLIVHVPFGDPGAHLDTRLGLTVPDLGSTSPGRRVSSDACSKNPGRGICLAAGLSTAQCLACRSDHAWPSAATLDQLDSII